MRTTPIIVSVVLPDGSEVDAGRLVASTVRGTQTATFTYLDSYLRDSRAYSLDPELPLVDWPTVTTNRSLFRCMFDSAPDRWGRALLQRDVHNRGKEAQRTLLDIDYLLGARDEARQGALRYRYDGGEPLTAEGIPRSVALPHLLSLADSMLVDEDLTVDLRDLIDAGSSLGGARPKASVWSGDQTLLLAKFPKTLTDEWDVPAWESVALNLAQKAGITVPQHSLVRVLDRNVLILSRFDRNGTRRIGYISAITLVSGVDGDHSHGYADVADYVESESYDPNADLPEIWRRAVYGLLISNTDNHLRNLGFLRETDGWRLSPAFDMNPNPIPAGFTTSVGFGNGVNTIADALDWCEVFRLDRHEALLVLSDLVDTVSTWRQCAQAQNIPMREITLMVDAFESHRTKEAIDLLG